jgi:hypothetical protein
VLDDPQLMFRIEAGLVAECSRQTEDQVVPGFVGEQQPCRAVEKLVRVGKLDNVHRDSLRCIGNA